MNYRVGETVWVLCQHRYWNTPTLARTTIEAVVLYGDRAEYRFAGLLPMERPVEIFTIQALALAALEKAIKAHKARKPHND